MRMRLTRNIILLPVWLLELFTRAKSFGGNPILGNKLLNLMGLHVFRLLLARLIFVCRQSVLAFKVSAEDRAEFKRNGYVVKENFLPDERFKRLAEEINHYRGEAWESIQGDTITQHIFLDYVGLEDLPNCAEFVDNPRLLGLLKYWAGKSDFPRFFIQRIKSHFVTGEADPQRRLHADTFHPAAKCWFFIEDVGLDDGPFTYIPGSHRLTWQRLKWEYHKSCTARSLSDGGSFRINDADLTELKLGKPISLSVKKNTLVVANVYGFHCRGQSLHKGVRTEIFGFFRPNPFNPFPGFDTRIMRIAKQWAIRKYYCYRDIKASRRGATAFWHSVKLT